MTTARARESLKSRTPNTSALGQVAVKYRKGYKCQTTELVRLYVDIRPEEDIQTYYVRLDVDGWLEIKRGYAWDGMSGAFNTKNSRLGSLVHDALYQLMRQGFLPLSHRPAVDRVFHQILLAKGMWKWRAWYIFKAVRKLAAFAADPDHVKLIYTG